MHACKSCKKMWKLGYPNEKNERFPLSSPSIVGLHSRVPASRLMVSRVATVCFEALKQRDASIESCLHTCHFNSVGANRPFRASLRSMAGCCGSRDRSLDGRTVKKILGLSLNMKNLSNRP